MPEPTTASQNRPDAPRVTVLLSTFNHEKYVAEAIDSVLAQRGVSFELVVMDDVSTDGTAAIADAYAARHPDLVRVSRPAANRFDNFELRRAIVAARSDYIAIFDGDDYWTDPYKLRKQVTFLDENPGFSMCFHDCTLVNPAGEVQWPTYWPSQGPPPQAGSYRDLARANYVPGASPLYRRALLANLPEWSDRYVLSDWAYNLASAEHGPVGFIAETMAAYRIHGEGLWSGMAPEARFQRIVAFIDDLSAHLPERAADLERGIGSAWADMVEALLRVRRPLAALSSLRLLWGASPPPRRWRLLAAGTREFGLRVSRGLARRRR